VVKHPLEFGRREIRIEDEAGEVPHLVVQSAPSEFVALFGRSTILPNNRPVNRPTGAPIPDNSRFALVGNTNCCKIAWTNASLPKSCPHHPMADPPYFFGVLLDPPRTWVVLCEFGIGASKDLATSVNNEAPSSRCPLINGKNEVPGFHESIVV
jgi:hypothetical protein